MSYTVPTSRTTGELVTASIWNTDIVDNILALKALIDLPNVVFYTATLADVGPSVATEVTALSFTVPGGYWNDGGIILGYLLAKAKNNSGGTIAPDFKVNVGAGAQVTIGSGNTYNNDANEYDVPQSFALMRSGSSVKCFNTFSPFSAIYSPTGLQESFGFGILQYQGGANRGFGTSTPANFSSDQTVSLKVTLGASHATAYYKPQIAKIIHFRG